MKKLLKKSALVLLLLIMIITSLIGCGSNNSSASKSSGDEKSNIVGKADNNTLVVGAASDPPNLDPHCAGESASVNVLLPVVEQLVRYNSDGELVPWLAEKWDMIDSHTWKFYLRKGVKFQNGDEMKASDVIFSFKRATTDYAANVAYIMNMVDPDGLEAIDDYTVIVKTKKEFAPFIYYLPYIGASIISEKAYADENASKNPVGTGPFKFVEYKKGDYTKYERFDEYWGNKAAYNNLIIKPIPDVSARYIALETGEIDIAIGLTVNEKGKIEENPDLEMSTSPTTVYTTLNFNCAKEPFSNLKFREALDYAIDEESIVKSVLRGSAQYTPGPVTPNTKYFYDGELSCRYDVEKAKELLKESGVDLSQTFEVCVNEDKTKIDEATIIQNQLKEVGVNVEIKVMEYATYLDYTKGNDKQMWFSAWGAVGFPEPDNNLYGPLHSSGIPANNTTQYSDPKLDDMLDKERNLPDGEEREGLIKDIQIHIRENVPYVTLENPENIVGIRKYVQNFKALPPTDQYYNNVSIVGKN